MAAKIKDGLFIGDAETSQSEVFINDNKISNLINLAGREVHNVWASHGLVYLTYYWEDRPDYKLFSSHEDALLTDIVEFIDVSISHGISVLLFSRNGTGRCVVAACLYLMMKYRWGFEKTYDYVYSKKPDIDLNKGFIQQMFALDMKLLAARQKAQAVKYGVDNGFKIEANMTISDISAMLPPVEAKRWNGWDPAYVIETAELAAQQSDGESKGEGGRYKDNKADHKRSSDPRRSNSSSSLVRTSHGGTIIHGPGTGEDDELILIYSFLNSKNTITVLPGPYLDVYDIPKNFKLKFNPVCYEEDVNWFPSAKTKAERVVLKGSRARLAAQTAAVYAQPKSPGPSTAAPGGGGGGGGHSRAEAAADSKRFSDAKALEPVPNNNNNNISSSNANSNGAYSAGAKSVVALENIAPMHVIRSQREAAAAELNNHNHSNNNSSSNSTGQYGNSGSGNHNHHNGSMQDDSGAGAQMYYAHPSMSNAAATPLSSSSNAAGGQTGEGYFNPDHSPPTSAYSSPVHANTHKEAPRNVNSGGGSGSGQSPNLSNDLYEFVGISTDQGTRGKTSREAPQRTWGPRDSIAVHKDHSSSSLQSAVSQQQQQQHQQPERGYGRGEDYKESEHSRHQQQAQQAAMSSSGSRSGGGASAQQPLSAEDRLRNLMADMQRHKAGAASSSHGPGSSNSASEARDIRDSSSRGERGPTGPSLYELATMQIPSNTAGARPHSSSNATGGNARRDAYDQDLEMEGLDQDSEVDPLSAFQRIQDQPYGSNSGTGSRGAGPSGGAVRARHDVITHGTGRPGSAGASGRYPASSSSTPAGPRSAWGGSSSGPGPAGGSRGTSPASSRPASPQPGASSGAYSGVPSRYASPSAKRTTGPGGSASVSSNLSVNSINSAGSNQVVGAGASSGSRVYRHGSPAPNVSRTNTAGLAPRSSASGPSVGRQHILASSGQQGSGGRALQPNSSIANSSVSSLGSGIVGAGTGNNASAQRPLSSSGRYASPSAAQQPTRRAPSSNAAAASLYSAEALQQQQQQQGERVRRSVNSSPMRGSGGGLSSSGGAGGTSTGAPRRYASPGPQQQQQQYDFDSLASGGTAGSGSRPGSRSGTPTSRATWRF